MEVYWIGLPRTNWLQAEEYGVWDIVKDDDGYKTFQTVEEAKEYAEALDQGNYFVIELKG